VQDEGSQLLALLTDAKRGEMVVDFCAGAGGKTLALGAAMRNTGRLYAFDVSATGWRAEAAAGAQRPVQRAPGADRARARRAHQAAGRQDRPGAGRCALLGPGHAAPQPRSEVAPVAAAVAGDAGQAARHPGQRGALLKPGGRLVYATCSLLRPRTRRSPRPSKPAQPGLRAAAGGRGAARRAWRARRGTGDGAFCACGRTATAPTAFSPPPGNGADPRRMSAIGADLGKMSCGLDFPLTRLMASMQLLSIGVRPTIAGVLPVSWRPTGGESR
jgi:hypothetical protein